MSTVETVRGPIDTADLGPTLMHEHIFVMEPEALQNYAHVWGESYWDEEVRVADAIAKLSAVREAGITTLVDPTAPGLGRYLPRIQRVNAEVDLNIIVASGIYAFLQLPNFFGYRPTEAIAEFFVREVRGRDRRHRRQGRIPQVLCRGTRVDRRRAADPRGDALRGRRDRRAGDGAHERVGEDRADRPRHPDEARRRPQAHRHRARRRQQRPRLPA